jgi:hypothetical protein
MLDRSIECRGDLVPLPPGHRDWLLLSFGSADQARAADGAEVLLHYRDAVDPEWIYPEPGRTWARIPVTRPEELTAIRLPDRPGLWTSLMEES